MEHKGTKTIETERLTLRAFRTEDAEAMFRNWESRPGGHQVPALAAL